MTHWMTRLVCAGAGILFAAPIAAADVIIDIEEMSLTPDGAVHSFSINTVGTDIEGFSFSGTFTDVDSSGVWASDTVLEISHNGSVIASYGGYTLPGTPWDFQGPVSTLNGTYAHGIGGAAWSGDGQPDPILAQHAVEGLNEWTFSFSNGWISDFSGELRWTDVQIVVHQVPAPGVLAAFGLVGLLGRTRRRHR